MKEVMVYAMAFVFAIMLFFGYMAWKNQNSNTLPEVYGVR